MSVRTSNRCSSPHTCAFVISCVIWRMNFFIRQEWQQRVTSHFLHSIPVPHHSIRTFQLFIRQYPEYDPIKHDAIKIPYNIYVLFTADLLWYFPAKDITLLLLINNFTLYCPEWQIKSKRRLSQGNRLLYCSNNHGSFYFLYLKYPPWSRKSTYSLTACSISVNPSS